MVSTSEETPTQMNLIVNNVKCWSLAIDHDFLNTLCHTPPTPLLLVVSQSTIAPSPSGWLDCRSACCSIWPWGPSARAVWDLWGRLPAQEEGEGHADCKWQWMVEWIVNVHKLDMAGFVCIRWKFTRRSEFLCFPRQHMRYHAICAWSDGTLWTKPSYCHDKLQPDTYWKWKGNSNSWW